MSLFTSKIINAIRSTCLASLFVPALVANATESVFEVQHLVNEQNIVSLNVAKKFLLLPVQENAPECKIGIINNNKSEGVLMNVRLAREKVDYYVPYDISAYVGQDISIDIQGMPSSSLCWKEIKLSDTFDSSNRETYRPVYHPYNQCLRA